MNNILISVIIPTYNSELYIDECINSVLDSIIDEYKNYFEIVVIDDGSTDNTIQKINTFKEKFNNLVIIPLSTNTGTANARNIGLNVAKGEYIYFLDSDDKLNVNKNLLVNIYNTLKYNNLQVLAFSGSMFKDPEYNGSFYNESYYRFHGNIGIIKGDDYLDKYLKDHKSYLWLHVYENKFLKENNITFEEGINQHEDELFNFKVMINCNTFMYVPSEIVNRRLRNNSMMSENYVERGKSHLKVVECAYKYFMENKDRLNNDACKKYLNMHVKCCADYFYWSGLKQNGDNIIDYFYKVDNEVFKPRKRQILFLMHCLSNGGAEKVLETILNHMDYDKYDVDLYVLAKEQPELYSFPKEVSIRYFYKDMHELNQAYYIDKTFNKNFFIPKKYDVEIGFLGLLCTWAITKFGNPKARKISWLHSEFEQMANGNSPEYCNTVYDYIHDVIAITPGTADTFIKYLGNKHAHKLQVISNPIDTQCIIDKSNEYEFEKDNIPTVISMGRLTWQKNYSTLITVHRKLLDHGLKHRLLILGEGEDRKKLENLISILNVKDTCKLMGYVENPYPILKSADIFVSSSNYEAMGLVIAEAMILNKPIVATDNAGPKELLGNGEGIIVYNTEASLEYAIRQLLVDPELRNFYKNKLSNIKEYKFDSKFVMKQIEELFNK